MRNFVQPGAVLTAIAPSGGVLSGQGVLVNALFGVATYAAEGGAQVELSTEGVYQLPKAASAMAFGRAVYWDGAKVVLTSSGNKQVGLVAAEASETDETVAVKLTPGLAA